MAEVLGTANVSETTFSNATTARDVSGVDIFVIILQMLLSVFIMVGNVLTILAVRRTPRLHTVANMYVVSLAVADFLAGLVLPFYAIKFLPGLQKTFDDSMFLCLSRYVVLIISAGNSMLAMVLIAIDRLIYIALPMKYSRILTKRRTRVAIATSWVIAFIVGTMPLYYNNWSNSCELFDVVKREYQIGFQVVSFCISCIVVCVCYSIIFRISYHQRKSLVDLNVLRNDNAENRRVKSTFRREWPMIKMFMLVFGVFFVCWCPVIIGMVIGSVSYIDMTIMNFLVLICLLNSGMNFIIYGVKNKDFQRAYRRMLCCPKQDNMANSDTGQRSGSANDLLST